MKVIKNLYLTQTFFTVSGALAALFVVSFFFNWLLVLAQVLTVLLLAAVAVDILLIFQIKQPVDAVRVLPKVLSLGDPNPVRVEIRSRVGRKLSVVLMDEVPEQFQLRDFEHRFDIEAFGTHSVAYDLTPTTRGLYHFGNVYLFLAGVLHLAERRVVAEQTTEIPVYPSIIQMKKYALYGARNVTMLNNGIKKMRRIGHSYEFDQIKNYVRGDDYRSINWKATGRRNQLMVNQYEDERAQQVYAVIDNSRAMKMPFAGLSLLDYAINSSLVILNVALQKNDRAGLITFSDKIGTIIKAESSPSQLNHILHALYNESPHLLEADYERMYQATRRTIHGRSLFFLYTNFESTYAMERVLPVLRRLNMLHLLVVVVFVNTEIQDYTQKEVTSTNEIYLQTVAQQFITEKEQIVQILRQFGIQTILTRPENLSINSINKYLELKSRGLI